MSGHVNRVEKVGKLGLLSFLALVLALGLPGCGDFLPGARLPKLSREYQAVLLDNGQVLFGKLEQAGGDYPVLSNVFVGQAQVNPETKELTRTLVRRSVELHNPDYMTLNARHIVAIKPVAPNSRVAQVIKQAEAQAATPPSSNK